MSHLTPCPSCGRHVRATEARCPFCQASLSVVPIPEASNPEARPATLYGLPAISRRRDTDDTPTPVYDSEPQAPSISIEPTPVRFREDAPRDDAYRSMARPEETPRAAPMYGGPPPRRRRSLSLIFVGGVAIVVYLLLNR